MKFLPGRAADQVPPDGRLSPSIESLPGWPSAPPIGCPRIGAPRSDGFDTHSVPMQTQKGDPVGSPFNSGTDQKNQLKVIVDDPYLYRSSFSFAAS